MKDKKKDRQDKRTSKGSPKDSLKILNTREKKEINQQLQERWGCALDKDMVFLLSTKEKLYIADKDISKVDLSKLRVDKIGLYVCTVNDKGIRLTIDGSQILGPKAEKNVVDVDEAGMHDWFRGEDLEAGSVETAGCEGFVILRHKEDFIGCGKVTERGILNFVPKARRISATHQ